MTKPTKAQAKMLRGLADGRILLMYRDLCYWENDPGDWERACSIATFYSLIRNGWIQRQSARDNSLATNGVVWYELSDAGREVNETKV